MLSETQRGVRDTDFNGGSTVRAPKAVGMCCPQGCLTLLQVLRVVLQGLALLAELSCPAHALSEITLRV